MKKSNKFVLGLVLSAGVIGCFGTAFALYENKTDAKDFSIGIGSVVSHTESDDNINYKFGAIATYSDATCETEFTGKLNPDNNKVYVKIPLSFDYTKSATTSAQDTVVGHLKVQVDIAESVAKNTTVSAKLTGYDKNGEGQTVSTYFTKNKMSDFFSEANYTTTAAENGYVSQTKWIDTAVDASSISCVVGIDMSSALTANGFLDLAEIDNAFKVTVDWSPYKETYAEGETWTDDNLKPTAYVRGDNSDWQCLEDYRMVPNIYHSGDLVEWQYKLLKGFTEIKVYDSSETTLASDGGWIYCRAGEKYKDDKKDSVKLDGGNASLYANNSYSIYYTRNETYTEGKDNKQGFYVKYESGTDAPAGA